MRNAIITLLFTALLVAGLFWFFAFRFDPVRPYGENLSNALWFIGMPMFFFGLISLTGANRIFIAIGYTFKNIFKRHRQTYRSYHEYMEAKNAEKEEQDTPNSGFAVFFISIIYLIIAFILM